MLTDDEMIDTSSGYCPVHAQFRCHACYPGRFTTPLFTYVSTDPLIDPEPRNAVMLQDGNGNLSYISSVQAKALLNFLMLIVPQSK